MALARRMVAGANNEFICRKGQTQVVVARAAAASSRRGLDTAGGHQEVNKELRQGLPFERLTQFRQESGFGQAEAEIVLRIPRRTLARRREQGRLSWEEAERLYRLSELFRRTLEAFRGNEADSRGWLTRRCRALGDAAPMEFASIEADAREVEKLLGRLQHGVFS